MQQKCTSKGSLTSEIGVTDITVSQKQQVLDIITVYRHHNEESSKDTS